MEYQDKMDSVIEGENTKKINRNIEQDCPWSISVPQRLSW